MCHDTGCPIPYGYCHCGCLSPAPLMPHSYAAKGMKRGEPYRYIQGHYGRLSLVPYAAEDRGFTTPCWIWKHSLNATGYGATSGKAAHVQYWELENGPVPPGKELDHLCRQRPCCNPAHLEPVTHTENVQRGALCKLTKADVRAIRSSKETPTTVAQEFGITRAYVCHIRTGRARRTDGGPITPKKVNRLVPRPDPNPSGVCLCGCGQAVQRAQKRTKLYRKGEHPLYIHHHKH